MKKVLPIGLLVFHCLFWFVFLRHVPFFIRPLSFLDFDDYIRLWRGILLGSNPYLMSGMITLGPPLVFLPYLPFVFLPLVWSQLIFFLLNVMAGYLACIRLAHRFFGKAIWKWLALSLLLFTTFPARFSLLMGQPGLILMFLVTVLVLSSERVSKFSLGLLIVCKTFFVFTLLAYLKKTKALALVIVGLSLTVLAALPLLNLSAYTYYLSHTLPVTTLGALGDQSTDYYNQSLKSSLHRLDIDVLYLPLLVCTLLFLSWRIFETQDVKLAVVTSVFVSPVVWQHYLVFFFPIYVYLFSRERGIRKAILLTSFLLTAIAFPFLHQDVRMWWSALLACHMFLGILVLLLLLVFPERKKHRDSGSTHGNKSNPNYRL